MMMEQYLRLKALINFIRSYFLQIQTRKEISMKQQTIAFDFDGVIHSYVTPWVASEIIPDPPVIGIKDTIDSLREQGYKIAIVSSRCLDPRGIEAVKEYLDTYNIVVDRITSEKIPAICYVDDRAICFDGHPETLMQKIVEFKPWNRK